MPTRKSKNTKLSVYEINSFYNGEKISIIEGPSVPSLQTLRRKFCETYNIIYIPPAEKYNISTNKLHAYSKSLPQAVKKANKHGYSGTCIEECFVSWLLHLYDFREIKFSRFAF